MPGHRAEAIRLVDGRRSAILSHMNIRLKNLLTEAEARLDPEAQERLGDLVEAFVSTWEEDADFSPEELEHLRRLDAEPFVAASDEDMKALFARRG